MFLGATIGDGLGMPVETFTPEKIKEKYGITRVTEYLVPTGHKWFDGRQAGTTTDDAQLTLAVAEGLIESGFDMNAQARKHVEAFQITTAGWGRTTKTAIRNLQNGAGWQTSGVNGVGNGVAMKIAPVGAYLRAMSDMTKTKEEKSLWLQSGFEFVRNLTLMTHRSRNVLCSTVGMVVAFYKCLEDDCDVDALPGYILKMSKAAKGWITGGEEDDDVVERLALLSKHGEYDAEKLIAEFGGGSCYCYNSIPFALMFFLNNPRSIDALYDVVSAGGDADTNGSMVGALLGALNGEEIFPKHLVDGLDGKDHILEVADLFWEAIK
ncbi:MAG: ADP-ribosylglycohydrolase family protein [Proteobacteria bacterium]|jgi:ADP-ribosylglycohydrolase|nr:ADP-ribosylglycohydrolase family protein [Pseudomonadota bacterium]